MAEKKEDVKPAKSNKKLFIIIGAAVLVLLIGAGVAGFLILKKEPPPEEKDPAISVPVPDLTESAVIGPMVDIEEFIVNIISADSNHYVKTSLTVELNKEETREEVVNRMPQVRDAILLLLGNKTYEELQDLQGKKQLKAELMSKINSFLQTGKVKSVYFTNFVVQ